MPATLEVQTGRQTEFIDLTARIQAVVAASGVAQGLCHVFVPHTTAGVTINENADPSVTADILMVLNKIISDREPYRHAEGNSPAHIKASLMGPQLTVFVSQGRLLLGTWQGIYFCEFDGPRHRRLYVKITEG
jgi:secondary thiamine-phosphate synthase enzyme